MHILTFELQGRVERRKFGKERKERLFGEVVVEPPFGTIQFCENILSENYAQGMNHVSLENCTMKKDEMPSYYMV